MLASSPSSGMDSLTRAALVAIAVFWGICALFFVQPFTGWFLMVAIPAAIIAGAVFLGMRPRSPTDPRPEPELA